jgi:hypothetical protein
MSKQNIYLTIIFMLMLTTGFIIYFMYLNSVDPFYADITEPAQVKSIGAPPSQALAQEIAPPPTQAITPPIVTSATPAPTPAPAKIVAPIIASSNNSSNIQSLIEEQTDTPVPQCILPDDPASYRSVMSRYFGVGFNITYVQQNNKDYYLINHIPISSTGTLGGCYSITADNLLTIKLQNSTDTSQLWSVSSYVDTISTYYAVIPLNNNSFSLQYENGSLSLRPFNSSSIFEGQKWLRSKATITRGIPVLNNSPASLFTSEFDPYASPQGRTTLNDQNAQQVNDVIIAVKSGIQQYLGKLENDNNKENITTSSSLGQKDLPLNINLSLSPSNKISSFANVDNTTLSKSALSIMDKYGPSTNSGGSKLPLYSTNNLENEINQSKGCRLPNINDYTSNRVSSCNCKL